MSAYTNMTTDTKNRTDIDSDVKVKRPSKYNVVFFNDEQTPMNFVVELLMAIFGHEPQSATKIMMTIHTEDKGIAGTYEFEIAEQKAAEAHSISLSQGFQLKIKVEPN